MVKVSLSQKTVKLGHSGAFQKVNHGEGIITPEDSKIRPFWSVSESQISKFSSTMVKVSLTQKTVKIRPLWSVSESQISKFSSTMVKVSLPQKTVKLGHSGAFQKVKFQHFLQPW